MEFSIKHVQPGRSKAACVIVGVFEARKLSAAAAQLDEVAQGHIAKLLRRGDMEGKSGTTLLLHNVPGVPSERVLLVGLGRESDFGVKQFREAVGEKQ